jgi:hypothetical protein
LFCYLSPDYQFSDLDNENCIQDSITKIGPWGGDSGSPSDVDVLPRRLISVVVHSSMVINSLTFTYNDCDGQQQTAGPWGGSGEPLDGNPHTVSIIITNYLLSTMYVHKYVCIFFSNYL